MIVGISGAIGVGKDVVASWLAHERGFTILRFSDALKREVASTLSSTMEAYVREHFGNDETERVGVESLIHRVLHEDRTSVTRALMQEWGTDLRRSEDQDYWVRTLADRLADLSPFVSVVIPDVRFENEARLIRTVRGRLIRVTRPNNPSGPSAHISEAELARWTDWDREFVNAGTMEVLEREVAEWLDGLSVL